MDGVKQRIESLETTNRKIFAVLARLESTVNERMATKDDLAALRGDMMTKMDDIFRRFDAHSPRGS